MQQARLFFKTVLKISTLYLFARKIFVKKILRHTVIFIFSRQKTLSSVENFFLNEFFLNFR